MSVMVGAQSASIAGPDFLREEVSTGTTIMAVEYDGGVVIGADSRTSSGSYVANRVTDKLTKITDRVYCCRSGSAADTQAIADYVKLYLDMHMMEKQDRTTVKTAARVFQQMCYGNRDQLSAGIICAGWDKEKGGSVYSIPLGGMLVRQPFTIGGSGSSYIYGYCDANYKKGMTREECEQYVINSVAIAMSRDNVSGGCIRIAAIHEHGVDRRHIPGDKIPKLNAVP